MISPQFVVLFCGLLFSVSNSSPSLCTPGQLSIDGSDVIESHRGYLLLIVYMPLQCSHCHRQLRELSVVAESISDLKIVIVCPGFEAPSLVERLQREFPLLLLQRDADGVFPSRGAQHHDQVLYDRCGRVSHTISHARGELTSYKDTLEAIESARHHAKCGWCQYDSKEGREMARKQQIRKQVNAYLRPNRTERKRSEDGVRRSDVTRNGQNYYQNRQQQSQQQQSQQQQYQQQTPTQRSQQQPVQQQFQQQAQQRQYQQNYQQPTQTYRPQQQRQAQGYSQSGHSAQGTQQQRDYYARQQQDRQTQYGQQQQQQQQHRQQGQAQSAHYDHNQHYAPRPTSSQVDSQFDQRRSEANYQNREQSQARYPQTPQIHTQNSQNYPERFQPTNQAVSQSQSSSTTGSTESSRNSYGEDDDYEYYEDTIGTTPKTETQIPRPSSFFPTAAMSHFPQSFQNMNSNQFNHQFGQMISEDNIPCAAYTDDICYQQQEKFGAAGLSKCCSKGIYFTDLCVPGKCTNTSVQLCCLQKFLQAKYSCCEDDSQSDNTTSTNKFSKCCYTKFVEKNDCCTVEAAKSYWGSVNEVCYPNTKVDYSTVKIEVIFSEGVRVVDLGENRLWDYECRNGGNRVQYAYLPDSEN